MACLENTERISSVKFWKRWPGDYAAKTADLTMLEHGAYSMLLDHYYATEAALPFSTERLAIICRAGNEQDRAAVAVIADRYFPVCEDGMRHNKRADEEIASARAYSEAQSERGALGMQKRWAKKQKNLPDQNSEPKQKKANGKHPIGDWQPSAEEMESLAAKYHKDEIQMSRHFAALRDYCLRNGKMYKDYSAAFRTAVRDNWGGNK